MLLPTESATRAAVLLLATAIENDCAISLDLPGGLELTVHPDANVNYLAAFFALLSAGAEQ
jgi:hypothetical protein